MNKIKKLLYLLQLEEYFTDRFNLWLKTNEIDLLKENKGKLKWTLRVKIVYFLSVIFSSLTKSERAVALSNNLIDPFFKVIIKIIVVAAKIELAFFPDLTKIIITGSYGKTTFKELLTFVLEEKYSVLKTPANKNTLIGIAQTILKGLKKSHQIFIIEAGAYKEGEIREICQLIKPSIGVITVIGWMHLERFGTIEKIRKTKYEIADFIKDKSKFFAPKIDHKFIDFEETVKEIGEILKVSKEIIEKRISQFSPPEHRLTTKTINKNLIILDDAYNSNPLGLEKALKEFDKYKNYQKIVISPGMIELGDKQFELNKIAAENVAKIADIFLVVGETNKKALTSIASSRKNFKTIYLNKDESFEEKIQSYLRPPSVILLENDLPDHYS